MRDEAAPPEDVFADRKTHSRLLLVADQRQVCVEQVVCGIPFSVFMQSMQLHEHVGKRVACHRPVAAAPRFEIEEQPSIRSQDGKATQFFVVDHLPQCADLFEAGPILFLQHDAGRMPTHDLGDHRDGHLHGQRQRVVLERPRRVGTDAVDRLLEIGKDLLVGTQMGGGGHHDPGCAELHRIPGQRSHGGEAGRRNADNHRDPGPVDDAARNRARLLGLQFGGLAHDPEDGYAGGAAFAVEIDKPVERIVVDAPVGKKRRRRDRVDARRLGIERHVCSPETMHGLRRAGRGAICWRSGRHPRA